MATKALLTSEDHQKEPRQDHVVDEKVGVDCPTFRTSIRRDLWPIWRDFFPDLSLVVRVSLPSTYLPIYVRGFFFCKEEQENRVKLLDR